MSVRSTRGNAGRRKRLANGVRGDEHQEGWKISTRVAISHKLQGLMAGAKGISRPESTGQGPPTQRRNLMNQLGIDGKIVADQRRHGLDVSQNLYTTVGIARQADAVQHLETALSTNN
jgi:hypothetical protein